MKQMDTVSSVCDNAVVVFWDPKSSAGACNSLFGSMTISKVVILYASNKDIVCTHILNILI